MENIDNARRILGFEDTSINPQALWTLILFRLASLRIKDSVLRLDRADGSEDVFQTLWPTAELEDEDEAVSKLCYPLSPSPPQLVVGDISAEIMQLDKTEEFIESIKKPYQSDESRVLQLLPQQRISNVVQMLDDLYDASIKAIDIVLVNGREWLKKVLEQTTPVFDTAWKDGHFSAKKNNQLLENLKNIVASVSTVFDKNAGTKTPEMSSKPSIKDYDTKERKEILEYALEIQRKRPEIDTNIRIAEIVSEKYPGFRDFHFIRWKKETGIDFPTEAKKIREAFMRGHSLPTEQSTPSDTSDLLIDMNAIFQEFRSKKGFPDMTLEEFGKKNPAGSKLYDEFMAFYESETDCKIGRNKQLDEEMFKDNSDD